MGADDDDGVLLVLPSVVAPPPQRVVPLLFVGGARGILLYLAVKDDNLFGFSNDPTFREEFLFPLLLPLLHVVPCSEPPYIGLAALHLADLGDIITNLLLC